MSDRIAVMANGRALQIDTPSRLYEAPRDREVAAFIGDMNFFDARIIALDGDNVTVDAGPLGRIAAPAGDLTFSAGDEVLVAIRPEKFSLAGERRNAEANAVEGILDDAAYLGDRSHFYVRLGGIERPIAVSVQNLARSLDGIGERRSSVWLSWPDDAVVLLRSD